MLEDDDLNWWHLAICQGMNDKRPDDEPHQHKDYFYDEYEKDPVMAKVMDSICMSCPVRQQCLRDGIENGEYGLWGGIFLDNGKIDKTRNAHKTDETWIALGYPEYARGE
jgi:hypothetical protein